MWPFFPIETCECILSYVPVCIAPTAGCLISHRDRVKCGSPIVSSRLNLHLLRFPSRAAICNSLSLQFRSFFPPCSRFNGCHLLYEKMLCAQLGTWPTIACAGLFNPAFGILTHTAIQATWQSFEEFQNQTDQMFKIGTQDKITITITI